MFRHGKIRAIAVVTFAVILSVISMAVKGLSPAPVTVKLTPAMVSVDTTELPPKLAREEMDAVWRLFDRDTDKSYTPAQSARVTVFLPGQKTLSRVRVYGPSSYQLNVYRDNDGNWEPVLDLTGLDLTALGPSWNTFTVPDSELFSTTDLLLEFIPQGNVTFGIREIELWGPDVVSGEDSISYVSLDGIGVPQEALDILSKAPSHIMEFSAAPSEIALNEGASSTVSLGLARNPALFKRAYILYDGYNLVRSVSIRRRINRLSWSGGFLLPQPEDATPTWSSYIEEINPAWLVQGENRIELQSTNGSDIVRGLKFIVETDSGWNAVLSVSEPVLYDGDVSTAYEIHANSTNPAIQINFERMVQPESVRIHIPGQLGVTAGLQYSTGSSWQDVKPGWTMDFSTMQAGWNEIAVPEAVTTDALRLVLYTHGLRIKPGVHVGSIDEVRASASPVGPASTAPRIVLSYPRNGEFFGRTAYLQGFVVPSVNAAGNTASVSIETKAAQPSVPDGSFSLSLTKDDTRFYAQPDEDAWDPIAQALYDGTVGAERTILLNKNVLALPDKSVDKESRQDAPFADNREKHSEKVAPGQAKKIQYKGVTVDIPEGAVDVETEITIVPLTEADLARLNPGMVNVTFPDAGYRFLPHGMKFKKPIKISFGYSKQLFAAGQADDEVNMYYYDEAFIRWQRLARVKVDPVASVVESHSDHFTDIINSTLVVPEHPQALSFNPNSIKDIKAADPSANINLVEPPRANNRGTANLSYPIEVPPGRNKLQPNISVQYNSGGGNGWMGLGWDIAMQAVTIDTRWGVPRYDGTYETETYMLNGEQLSPVAHRDTLKERADNTTALGTETVKIFHSRVEGQFRRIIRHGSSPAAYWWEVIDKNGTRYFYGAGPETNGVHPGSVLTDYSGHIFKWALREIRDTNNNFVRYHYATVMDAGVGDGTVGVPGYQLYLKTITYTGSGTSEGAYAVTFVRDRELGEERRSDVSIDARGGFKAVTADLLRKIEILYGATVSDGVVTGGTPIRQYEFLYSTGAFQKTLLESVTQYGKNSEPFNQHTFSYHDEITDGVNYRGFFQGTTWYTSVGGLDKKFLGTSVGPSAISGSEGTGGGGSFSIGFAPLPTKYLSFNGMIGAGKSNSEGTLSLVDIDGDGLPDTVYNDNGTIRFHRNTVTPKSDPLTPIYFKGETETAANMGALSEDESINFNAGGQAYIFGLNLILDLGTNITTQRSYLSDVNGDGLIDVVRNGTVWFNRWKNKAANDFTPEFATTSAGTEFPIAAGPMDPTGMLPDATFQSIEERLLEDNPLMDAVRRWKAPYSGQIAIDGDVSLINVLTDPEATPQEKERRESYSTADGVRAAIERPGMSTPLWSQDISEVDETNTPNNTGSIDVKKGDVIYFRVQSQFDGAFDDVSWAPRVRYLMTTEGGSAPEGAADVNSLDPYVYQADKEFVYAGRVSPMEMPYKGKVRLAGRLDKTGVTTDDVRISVYQFADSEMESQFQARRDYMLIHTKRDPIVRHSLRWDEVGSLSLDGTPDIDVEAKDKLFIIVEIDSNIDLTKLQWSTTDPIKLFYTEAYRPTTQPSENEDGEPLTDEDGNPIGWEPGGAIDVRDSDGTYLIQITPQQEMNFYPDNALEQAQSDFTADETGWLVVIPQVTPNRTEVPDGPGNIFGKKYRYLFDHDTEMTFTVKQRGELVRKKVMYLNGGTAYNARERSFALPVYKGERFFFDYSTRDTELYDTLESTGVTVHYIRPQYTVSLPDVPVNKTNKVAEWPAMEGTATVLPGLEAMLGAPALSGEVVLHVTHVYEDENEKPVSVHVVDRRMDFDTQVPFNSYEYAFDLPDVSEGTFVFSYTVPSADLAAVLSTHAVTIPVQTGFNATQQEFSGLELFPVPPGVPDSDDGGKALLPVGDTAARVAIAPVVKQNGILVSSISGTATLTVVRRYTVVDDQGNEQILEETISQQPVSLIAGQRFNPGEHTFDVDVQPNDTLVMHFTTEDSDLASLGLEWGLWSQTRRHIGGNAPTATPPSMLHRYGYWDLFANSYRGWAYAGYNSEGTVNGIALKDQPIISSRLVLSSNPADYEVPTDHDSARSKRVKDFTAFPAAPQPEYQRWFAGDESWRIKAGRMQSSRMGLDYVKLPRGEELKSSPEGGAGATAPPRMSIVELETTTGIGFLVNINHTETPGQGLLDFMDMNGDRFPDVVGGGSIQYTEMIGGLGSKRGNTGTSYVRDSQSTADNIAPGGTVQQAIASAKGYFNPKGGNANTQNKNSSFGLTGSLGKRENDVNADYFDVNGDGLPDRVYDSGGVITVKLNLGYSFAEPEVWGAAVVDDSETKYINAGVSYNDGVKGYAGSLSLTRSLGKTRQKLLDMNGDGLPDRVAESAGGLSVGINTGNGFDVSRSWTGASATLGNNQSFSLNGGVSYNITIGPICIVACYIDLNPGISLSTNTARAESTIQDVNGDGYPDRLESTSADRLSVAVNKTGRTNLLRSVKRPLGGKFEIEYEREGNTYDMPQSQWVMTRVTLSDGTGNAYRTDYSYSGGYQDRYEREFYGFRTVTENQAPETASDPLRGNIARQIVQTFYNGDYYRKGLVRTTVTRDMKSNPGYVWSKSENEHELRAVKEGINTVPYAYFPALIQTTTNFYDGSQTNEENRNKLTHQTFDYDDYGNVKTFFDAGEEFTNEDDISATITYTDPGNYSNYIIKPETIQVFGTGSKAPLRSRKADYDSDTGNLIKLTLHNTKSPESVWQMTYHTNGNLWTIADPVGYILTYTYDSFVATHVTRIEDNFPAPEGPYYSTASYNILFGQIAFSTDLNGNIQANGYDQFGRLICVYGPYDPAPTNPDTCAGSPTITFVYANPVIGGADGVTLEAPARAVTSNKAVSVKGSDPVVIKTITYVDGMKRIIQTKKDADVHGAPGMTVSGLVVFDELGRVEKQDQPVFRTKSEAFEDLAEQEIPRNFTRFTYDTLDRTTMVVTPDEAVTTTTYAFGQFNGKTYAKTIVVDPEGNKVGGSNHRGTKISYKDVDDRIVAVVEFNRIKDPVTGQKTLTEIKTTYNYNPLGQITHVVDNKGNTTIVEYDDVGRRTAIDNPDTGRTKYDYDANGNLISKFTANNHKISYKYVFNRLTDIEYPNSLKTVSVSYEYGRMGESYNRAGRIKRVTDESGVEERFYGRLGEVRKEEKSVEAKTPSAQRKKFTTEYVFDSFGRMWEMTYPDGEKLQYAYDGGGLLKAAWGEKNGNRYDYVTNLLYDEFGQRTHIAYGNGTKTDYAYDSLTRRLDTLVTKLKDGRQIQNLKYTYDLVGNVTVLANGIQVATNTALPAGPVNQEFEYDDLYQIVDAKGGYTFGPGKKNNYHNEFFYDTIGNFTMKKLEHEIIQPSTTKTFPKETNYALKYIYDPQNKPHAVRDAGDKIYSYDDNGNMLGWTHKKNGTRRVITWNEENRVRQIDDNGQSTYFLYDDAGERVVKRGQHGETIYVNRFYAVRNGELGTKQVFAGETRVLSKLVKTPNTVTANTGTTTTTTTTTATATIPGEQGLDHGRGKKLGIIKRLPDGYQGGVNPPVEKDLFYYHGDHLGSSNMITDAYGAVYQHLEYFPYGETWIEEGGSYGGNTPGYKFTGKELDPETGLYYYGARYYDSVLSRWISADPAFEKYLPSGQEIEDNNLPGRGGAFNPLNLSLFNYAHQNPVLLVDPDGNFTVAFEYNPFSLTGAVAIQAFEKGPIFQKSNNILGFTVNFSNLKPNFYTKWVTRGVNTSGQQVAIVSDIYTYTVINRKGMLQGRLEEGKEIPTIAPNEVHGGKSVADGILIHPMNLKAKIDPKHGNQPYLGSEGCHGPLGKEAMKAFTKGKKAGEEYTYTLIRPTERIERNYQGLKKAYQSLKDLFKGKEDSE